MMESLLKNEEERKPELTDSVFRWSINDIMKKDLYRNKVNQTGETFSSVDHYLNSFINPLLEETHADLRSNLLTLRSAPSCEILKVKPLKRSKPSTDLFHLLQLRRSKKKGSNVYEPEFGDLIALTEIRPRCIDDLNGRKWSYRVALVKRIEGQKAKEIVILSSSEIIFEKNDSEVYGKTSDTLFAVYLTNLTTNIRIWKALHPDEGGNRCILSSVLRFNPSMGENCGLCLEKIESLDLSKSRELIMPLGLDDSQRDAVLKCIALRYCNHQDSVKLIWGPPGTGKSKTIASLLFSLFRMKCRTLTCAPTNVAVLGVAKRLMSCMNGTLVYDTYGLGDLVLSGNGKRMNIGEHEDLHDVFLDYRVSALLSCFAPKSGWRGSVDELTRLLEDPETQYQRYLDKLKCVESESENESESESESEDESEEEGSDGKRAGFSAEVRLSDKNMLRKLVIQNAEKNTRIETQGKVRVNKKHAEGSNAENVSWTFEEFFSKNAFRIIEKIAVYTEWLYTHMPTSHLPLCDLKNMIRALDLLQTLENFLHHNNWLKEALLKDEDTQNGIRLQCLQVLKLIRTINVPEYTELYQVRNFVLKHACLIFCTVSSSSKLHTEGMSPLELVIIDEAAQLKECESLIPLQLPGLRHAILVGDEKQLPAMVMSEICKKAGFGRSLFERLATLGHNKHLLNVQYRMHPSISLFPNKEFYGNQISNGQNVTERAYERHFLKEKIFGSYSFINITSGKEEFDNRHSRKNMVEVSVVAEIVSKLHKESMKSKEKVRVGCISPYKAQVFAIQESLGKAYSSSVKHKFSVNVRSVDGFQGGEEDIIIISTVRCNGNGSVGFLDDLQRANVALTRAKHCLWILGNAATLQSGATVWQRLVVDAKNRGCFHNAYEDDNLSRAISNALIDVGQQRSLFRADSILFKAAKWKVCFSGEFNESITRYRDSEIQKEAASLLEKLSSGWRKQSKDEVGIPVEGLSSQLLEWDVVKGPLRLVWTIDIVRENSTDTQVLKVLDILPISEVAEVAKKIEVLAGDYTMNQMSRCLYKRTEGGLMLPMSWPVDRSNSRSNYSTNDLATQLAATSLRNDLSSPRIRKHYSDPPRPPPPFVCALPPSTATASVRAPPPSVHRRFLSPP